MQIGRKMTDLEAFEVLLSVILEHYKRPSNVYFISDWLAIKGHQGIIETFPTYSFLQK